jgi:polyferredoxin
MERAYSIPGRVYNFREVFPLKKYQRIIHQWSWLLLFSFVIAGLFYPVIGMTAIICMLAPVVMAFFKGRMWCGYFCPRGSFNDIILTKLSRRIKVPAFFRTILFRLLFLLLLISGFMIQIIMAWDNLAAIGQIFVRMVLITTILTILLGYFYQPRTWCLICPMGTMAHFMAKIKACRSWGPHIFFKQGKCTGCQICSRNCPILIDVYRYKESRKVNHPDCLKCTTCVAKCPQKSLHVA